MRILYIILTMLTILVLEIAAYSFALDESNLPTMLVNTGTLLSCHEKPGQEPLENTGE
jgi:hypothetical protein